MGHWPVDRFIGLYERCKAITLAASKRLLFNITSSHFPLSPMHQSISAIAVANGNEPRQPLPTLRSHHHCLPVNTSYFKRPDIRQSSQVLPPAKQNRKQCCQLKLLRDGEANTNFLLSPTCSPTCSHLLPFATFT